MSDALRHNDGKAELAYMATMPNAWRGFARVCTYGGTKYARYNYLIGAPYSQYVNCLLRHLLAFMEGEDVDAESGCRHLDHLVWNALMLAEMSVIQPERDDRPCQKSST